MNLISLAEPGHLLDVGADGTVSHVVACQSAPQAENKLALLIKNNTDFATILSNQFQDNIAKLTLADVGTLATLNDEILIAQMLKELLLQIEAKAGRSGQGRQRGPEGFHYYDAGGRRICWYQFCYQRQNRKEKAAGQRGMALMQGYAAVCYWLCTQSDVRGYLRKVVRVGDGDGYQLSHLQSRVPRIGHFIGSLLNKQIPTPKIAYHSLEIIIDRVQWASSGRTGTPTLLEKPIISTPRRCPKPQTGTLSRDPPRRLKQSTSMTSLSGNKSRKYTKMSHLTNTLLSFKPTLVPKNAHRTTGESFYTSSRPADARGLGNSQHDKGKMAAEDWYKTQMSLFSRIKDKDKDAGDHIEGDSQIDLKRFLEEKENTRKTLYISQINFSYGSRNGNCLMDSSGQRQTVTTMSRGHPGLGLVQQNVCVAIEPRRKKMQLCSTLYAINERISRANVELLQPDIKVVPVNPSTQSRTREEPLLKNHSTISQIENASSLPKNQSALNNYSLNLNLSRLQRPSPSTSAFLQANLGFMSSRIQTIGNAKLPIQKSICTYVLMVYYFSVNRTPFRNERDKEATSKSMEMFRGRIQQLRANGGLAGQSERELQFLLQVDALGEEVSDQDKVEAACFEVLKKQFQRLKVQLIKKKSELIEKKLIKPALLFMLQLAVCISLVADIEGENAGMGDFSRESNKICERENEALMDLRAELTDYQRLF